MSYACGYDTAFNMLPGEVALPAGPPLEDTVMYYPKREDNARQYNGMHKSVLILDDENLRKVIPTVTTCVL